MSPAGASPDPSRAGKSAAPGPAGAHEHHGSRSAGPLANNLCTPKNPATDLADLVLSDGWIIGDVGKTNSSAVRDCLLPYKGKVVLLPTYDMTQLQGSTAEFHVTSFTFWPLLDFDSNPHIDNLWASFIGYGPARVAADNSGPPATLPSIAAASSTRSSSDSSSDERLTGQVVRARSSSVALNDSTSRQTRGLPLDLEPWSEGPLATR